MHLTFKTETLIISSSVSTSVLHFTAEFSFVAIALQNAVDWMVSHPWALRPLSAPSAQANWLPESHRNSAKSLNNKFVYCNVLQGPYKCVFLHAHHSPSCFLNTLPPPCTPHCVHWHLTSHSCCLWVKLFFSLNLLWNTRFVGAAVYGNLFQFSTSPHQK